MATATNQLTIVASLQDKLTRPLTNIERSTERLEKQFTKLSGAVQNAFQFYVRYRIFGLINRGISAVENAIPGLIARGQEWARTVDDIADSSGLAAEQSSLLAGVVTVMTGSADSLMKALGALSQQATNHGDVMRRYGIETRDANGHLLDSWTILRNVRRATSDLGNSFITTAAARDLFSRGGQTLLDFLTMSDAQFKLLTRDVKESGVIMSEAGLAAAEAWTRTQQRFEQTITGIGNQITQTVQPLLSRLVDGITNYLRANMAQIVGFVSEVISFVANAIAGFLGIDLSLKTMAERLDEAGGKSAKRERILSKAAQSRAQQTSTEDGYTQALNAQIDAIDRQLAAMSKAENAEEARREHARLLKDISDAKKELRDLRGESIFAAGMTAAEAELARQAQAADIVDAQKRVREAQQRLAEQERKTARDNRRIELQERKEMLSQRLSDHMEMLAKQAAADREAFGQIMSGAGGGIGKLPQSIREVMDAGKAGLLRGEVGRKWGEDFRASLEGFFDDLNDPTTGLGEVFGRLATVAQLVVDNFEFLVITAGILVGLNIGSSLLSFGAGLAAAGPALLGAGGFLVSVGLAAVATKLWADAINGWLGQIEGVRGTFAEIPNRPQAGRQEAVEGQIGLRGQMRGGAGFIESILLSRIMGTAFKGDEERSLAAAISQALADKTVTKADLQTYAGKVNELVGLMSEEGRSGESWEALLEQQRLLNAAISPGGSLAAPLAGIGAGLGPGSQFQLTQVGIGAALGPEGSVSRALTATTATGERLATQQGAISTALGPEGAMAKAASGTTLAAARLAPYGGRNVNQNLWQIATNTRGLNTNVPWGIANISLNIDGRMVLRMMGIPIRRANSTTRTSPTQ